MGSIFHRLSWLTAAFLAYGEKKSFAALQRREISRADLSFP